jgi:hypothetical protein
MNLELKARQLIEPYEPVLMYWKGRKFPIPDALWEEIDQLKGGLWSPYLFVFRNLWGDVQLVKESEVTDYGAIIYGDDRPDLEVPAQKPERCSTSNNFGLFIQHLTALRQVLKSAEKDGFCLDELLNSLKDFEVALKSTNSGS